MAKNDTQIIVDAYEKLIEHLEDREDVDDGVDGPTPNEAMQALQGQDAGIAALKRVRKPKPPQVVPLTIWNARRGLLIVHRDYPEWGTWTLDQAGSFWIRKGRTGARLEVVHILDFHFWRLAHDSER